MTPQPAHTPCTLDNGMLIACLPALGPYEAPEGVPHSAGFAACALMVDSQAPAEGRRFTSSTLCGWGMCQLVDNAEIIVSELLSNALRHGTPRSSAHRHEARPLWLGLLRQKGTVLCAVCDHSAQVPVLRRTGVLATSGRGLHIIDCLSGSWGFTPPTPAGKAVWATISSPGGPLADRELKG
ncbi:ATP-binding protein [Streptomyces lydicus]